MPAVVDAISARCGGCSRLRAMPRLFEDRVDDAGEAYYACREW